MKTVIAFVLGVLLVACCAQAAAVWTRFSENPVMSTITWGTFGEAPCVVLINGEYHMWYQAMESGDWTQIGYATSVDGATWVDYPQNPVLRHNHTWGEDALGGPCVIADGDTLRMWFGAHSSVTWTEWWLCYATSVDGINWTRYRDPVLLFSGETLGGTVVQLAQHRFRLYFATGGDQTEGSCGNFGIAESTDGVHWTVTDPGHIITNHTWTYYGRPCVVKESNTWHMWYAGRRDSIGCNSDNWIYDIGYAQSLDGFSWYEMYPQPALTHGASGTWDERNVICPWVMFGDGQWKMYYVTAACYCTHPMGLATTPTLDQRLPVSLSVFDAVAKSGGILLSYTVASETNNDRFEMMRGMLETGAFNRITTLPSQGNSASGHHYEYLDRDVTAGQTYWYYLADVDLNSNRTEHRELMRSATMTGSMELPQDYSLAAYPNPFNPSTTISFALPEADVVRIAVFDVAGRWIQTLVNEKRAAGNHTVSFDARDLPSGVYFARMESGRFAMTKKMALIR